MASHSRVLLNDVWLLYKWLKLPKCTLAVLGFTDLSVDLIVLSDVISGFFVGAPFRKLCKVLIQIADNISNLTG